MAVYSWLTALQANQEVSVRLGDPNQARWTKGEIYQWLYESLRIFNALTAYWTAPYTLTLTPPFATNWFQADGSGSPRQPTLTDTDIYTSIEYHLLEPPTGSTWSGTNQFNITDLAQACSRRRNEILQAAACNMAESPIAMAPNTSQVQLADSFLDVRRCRWVPAIGSPQTLQRGDALSFQRFTPQWPQTTGNPLRWDVLGSPPETLQLDTKVNAPSNLQVLGMMAGADFAPPTSNPLLMPDDWSWVLKWGALADVLSMEQEGKDLERAVYCRQRYEEGLKLMTALPWLLNAYLDNVPAPVQAIAAADRFNYEWQSNAAAFPEIVVGGIDLYAVSPVPIGTQAVTLNVVQNAPIPASDSDFIQVSRDAMSAIISEAQHLALFGMGGEEAKDSIALHKEFIGFCLTQNARLRESGIFATDLHPAVPKEGEQQPRYAMGG